MPRHADPTRRIPTYLQNNTVENFKWQLKLLLVLFAWIGVTGIIDEYKWRKKRKTLAEKR